MASKSSAASGIAISDKYAQAAATADKLQKELRELAELIATGEKEPDLKLSSVTPIQGAVKLAADAIRRDSALWHGYAVARAGNALAAFRR